MSDFGMELASRRFAYRLEAINDAPDYDCDVARGARVQCIKRYRRIMESHPSELAYDEFLDSPYWLALAEEVKRLVDYVCQRCRRRPWPVSKGLEVHHKTYAHRGFEVEGYFGDLEVLCRACHRRKHGISPGRMESEL